MGAGALITAETLQERDLVGRACALVAQRLNPTIDALKQEQLPPGSLEEVLRGVGEEGPIDQQMYGRLQTRFRELVEHCRGQVSAANAA